MLTHQNSRKKWACIITKNTTTAKTLLPICCRFFRDDCEKSKLNFPEPGANKNKSSESHCRFPLNNFKYFSSVNNHMFFRHQI
jgi:hypothetical protein